MDLVVRVLLVGLAAWRLSALLSYERGPFGVLARIRYRLTREPDDEGVVSVDGWLDHVRLELSLAVECVWCLSPWMAAATWFVWDVSPEAVAVGAAAAIIVLVERLARG